MIAYRVGPQYEKDRNKLGPELDLYRKKIAKTVDLFSRIKSTEQAEEVATIIYACRAIKSRKPDLTVTEQSILDYVLDWKPAWRPEAKRQAVAGAIRNLVLLSWVKAEISEDMIETV
jgi:hypothetical protein